MVQGDHYSSPGPDLLDVLSDGGLSALKAELRHQTIVYAMGSVAFLGPASALFRGTLNAIVTRMVPMR